MFTKAKREQVRIRFGLLGPTGSGKTFTMLAIGAGLGGRMAVIDTEHGSARIYADEFEFDTVALTSFAPERYIEAINAAAKEGYPVLGIDSLSHAWAGKDGLLEFVDKKADSGNKFAAWRFATPLHNRMVETILAYPGHVIVTMRTKMEYVLETNERGKQVPKKVGTQPIQRDGMEYEFTVVGDMDQQNVLSISKTRAKYLNGQSFEKPGRALGQSLIEWANTGEVPEPVAPPPEPPPPASATRPVATNGTANGKPQTPRARFTKAIMAWSGMAGDDLIAAGRAVAESLGITPSGLEQDSPEWTMAAEFCEKKRADGVDFMAWNTPTATGAKQ